jgi:predicted metal-dependent peptidase
MTQVEEKKIEISAEDKILLARIRMGSQYPFWSYLFNFLTVKEQDGLRYKTMATDGRNIFYDKDFINQHSLKQIMFGLMHETGHVALSHISRMCHREKNKWGQAIDFAINDILVQQPKLEGVPGMLHDVKYRGMSAENIYNLLPECDDQTFDLHMEPGEGDGEEGDGASSEADKQLWESRIYGAFQYARKQGKEPAGLNRLFKALTKPDIPWRAILHQFFQQYSRDDYSWAKPARMFLHMGMYLPSCHSQDLGHVYIVVDTSGSISENQGSQFLTEIQCIRNTYPMTMHLITCDAKVHDDITIERYGYVNFKDLKIHGGGGTDFRPAFDYIKEKKDQPTLIVFFTDGFGTHTNKPPSVPTLWAMTKVHEKVPFGRMLYIKE